jgi:hypothetical protein
MKFKATLAAVLVTSVSTLGIAHSQVTITGFGTGQFAATSNDFGGTGQTATTFNIAGTDFGLSLFGNVSPSPVNITGNTVSLSLTGTFTGTATSAFQINLFDNAGNDVLYQGSFSSFSQGVSSTVTLLPISGGSGVFNNNVVSLALLTTGTGSTVNLTLDTLSAVPEPSTWAFTALGGVVLGLAVRRKMARSISIRR